jgi:hypothetical protein
MNQEVFFGRRGLEIAECTELLISYCDIHQLAEVLGKLEGKSI